MMKVVKPDSRDIGKIRAELDHRLKVLGNSIHEQALSVSQDGGLERGGIDRGDESNQEVLTGLKLERASRELHELRLVEEAIDRLQRGEFGFCLDCGTDIDRKRLLANPTGRRCLKCQEIREEDQDERDRTPSL